MNKTVSIGSKKIGDGQPCYIIAEIGLNHNGDMDIAKKLIDSASLSGCDAVKFQKRTPELCVPPDQRDILRETPWGIMTYFEYRQRVEFGADEYAEIEAYCKSRDIDWFASVWDTKSVDFLEQFHPLCYKVPSAALTHGDLLRYTAATERPVMLSSGMSTMEQIEKGIEAASATDILMAHATSTYPCKPSELNLKMIHTLQQRFDCPIGYSGHEVGLQTTCAAVAMGATFIERHITLDRAMWGSDQAASIEPSGLIRLVRDIRTIEAAMGDGVKKVYESELPSMKKLRVNS